MVNYQEAKIYKIINDEMPGKVYYGSTCNTFAKRLKQHKCDNCTSKVLFEYGKPQMILVEKYPCNDKMELTQRERFYIENNECINKHIPGRTKSEYYLDHIDYFKNRNKKYREVNKEKILLQKKQKFNCNCGGKYTYSSKARHLKSKKHQSFIIS